VRALFLPLLLATAACSVNPQGSPEQGNPGTSAAQQDLAARISEIETASGGRLGLALHSPDKGLVYAYRGDERFAMCSTFTSGQGTFSAMLPTRKSARHPAG
jgi:beta-lactamase class A